MIKNIVVEGPNNVGKTTLINTLLSIDELKDWTVEHSCGNTPNTYKYYDALLKEEHVIYDRLHIGELVYPYIFKRQGRLTDTECLELCEKYNSSSLIIFVDADMSFVYEACKNKLEYFDLDTVLKERLKFKQIYDNLRNKDIRCRHIRNRLYDLRYANELCTDELINYILNELKE